MNEDAAREPEASEEAEHELAPDSGGGRVKALALFATGVLVLVALVATRPGPERLEVEERSVPVRVVPVARLPVVARATGYGTVQPRRTWSAVARVAGKVVARSEELLPGAFLAAGTELLRIEPDDYELAVEAAASTTATLAAQLAELTVEEENLRSTARLVREQLELAGRNQARLRKLEQSSSATQAALDEATQAVLSRRREVQELENALRTLPTRRDRLEAERRSAATRLSRARLDLSRCVITLPIRGRVAREDVELGEYVVPGKLLAVLDGVEVAEVTAHVPASALRHVVRALGEEAGAGSPFSELAGRLGLLEARVSFHLGDGRVDWKGRVVRIADAIDPVTRMIGVVVAVDGPYQDVVPGERPPLIKGMFVEVQLGSPPSEPRLVVPREALVEGQVRVVGREGRLELRKVQVAALYPRFAVLSGGLEVGERVVLSELHPAIPGMLLVAEEDQEAARSLREQAAGGGEDA